ncbi:hypothetical protein N9M66_00345 [Litoreibacter sp.]|nr:hypothetical protein [Litoreibacter sp.]
MTPVQQAMENWAQANDALLQSFPELNRLDGNRDFEGAGSYQVETIDPLLKAVDAAALSLANAQSQGAIECLKKLQLAMSPEFANALIPEHVVALQADISAQLEAPRCQE